MCCLIHCRDIIQTLVYISLANGKNVAVDGAQKKREINNKYSVRLFSISDMKTSVTLWEQMSLSGWKNTSIIISADTNANPSAMLAICGWSAGAEITEENGHK